MDTFSKSDPLVQVFSRHTTSESWYEIGRTEIIWDNLNPEWTTTFLLDYHFEEQTYLSFKVFDANDKVGTIERCDYIGECESSIHEVLTQPGH
jgi:hypothetical protein